MGLSKFDQTPTHIPQRSQAMEAREVSVFGVHHETFKLERCGVDLHMGWKFEISTPKIPVTVSEDVP
jgi:hypothetical protein